MSFSQYLYRLFSRCYENLEVYTFFYLFLRRIEIVLFVPFAYSHRKTTTLRSYHIIFYFKKSPMISLTQVNCVAKKSKRIYWASHGWIPFLCVFCLVNVSLKSE